MMIGSPLTPGVVLCEIGSMFHEYQLCNDPDEGRWGFSFALRLSSRTELCEQAWALCLLQSTTDRVGHCRFVARRQLPRMLDHLWSPSTSLNVSFWYENNCQLFQTWIAHVGQKCTYLDKQERQSPCFHPERKSTKYSNLIKMTLSSDSRSLKPLFVYNHFIYRWVVDPSHRPYRSGFLII